jgi:F0F1-type ATP synthase membrane subunit b/b'
VKHATPDVLTIAEAEAAIAEVLAAQAQARADIDAARTEAASRIEQARADVRRIDLRTGERLQRVLARHDAATRARIAAIDGDAGAQAGVSTASAAIADAVARVAAALTGDGR